MYTDYEDEKESENVNDNDSFYSDDDGKEQNSERIKRIAIFILIFVIVIVLILLMAKGCSKKNTNTNTNNSTSQNEKKQTPTILINRETISLSVGEEFELQADVLNTKNTEPIISWRSDDTSVASVNDEGFVKAEGEGTTAIIATYKENNKIYRNACVVTVTQKIVKLESIKLSQKEINLNKDGTFLIEISISPKDAKVEGFVFESSDTNVVTVNDKGKITAIGTGTAVVTVKNEDGSISETMSINVTDDKQTVTVIEPTEVEIVGFTNGLTVGKTTQAIHNVLPNSATNKEVTWKSSNENVAKVNGKGVITGVGPGTCTITVSTYNNITASKEITVSANIIPVDKITINGSTTINMKVGGTKYLLYTISPSNASNKKVTYKSSNPSVVYVDSNGIMAGVGVGSAIVTITTQDGGKTAVANVTVTAPIASGTSSTSSSSSSSNNSSSNNSSSSSSNNNSSSSSSNYSTYNYTTDSSTYNYNSYEDNTTTNTCNAYDMVKIQHNQSKQLYPDDYAIVSTISFDNTKPFTKTGQIPTLELTEFDSNCIKFLIYTIYYGTSVDKVDKVVKKDAKLLRAGETIKLENGNGYYKIDITGQTKSDGSYLTKSYYAHVNNDSSKKYISISSTKNGSKRTFTITKENSLVKRVYYCITKGSNSCDMTIRINGLNSSKTAYYGYIGMENNKTFKKTITKTINQTPTMSKGYKVCFQAFNGTILVDKPICQYV